MNRLFSQFRHGFAAFVTVCITGIPHGYADDTKIYKASASDGAVQPNVLFIIDTSGSMDAMVDVTEPYDSSRTYVGTYDPNYTYWEKNANSKFESGKNQCAASSTALATSGNYTSNFASWQLSEVSEAGPPVVVPGYTTDPWTETIEHPTRYYRKNGSKGEVNRSFCYRNFFGIEFPNGKCTIVPGYTETIEHAGGDVPETTIPGDSVLVSSGEWKDLTISNANVPVECSADAGVHGSNSLPEPNFPANETPSSNAEGVWEITDSGLSDGWKKQTLYTANYLNYLDAPDTTTQKTRLKVVQDVTTDLINTISGVNIGLMRFDQYSTANTVDGGAVIHPIEAIDTAIDNGILTTIDDLTHDGGTPLSEALYEAALYYRGDGVDYGDIAHPNSIASSRKSNNSSTYKSPITDECQVNNIILLTDGEPNNDGGANTKIQSLVGGSDFSDNHLDELAVFLHDENQIDNDILPNDQTINTYTIGFDTNAETTALLKSAATAISHPTDTDINDSDYYNANDVTSLAGALEAIFYSVISNGTTFTAPAVSVNAFNSLEHRDELYYALFEPSLGARWKGNLKRYRLNSDGVIVDANDVPAVGDDGYFKSTAQSEWSSSKDGADVSSGGAAEQLTRTRNIYTYTGTTPSNVALNAPEQKLSIDNSSLTTTLLEIDGDADASAKRDKIIAWSLGQNATDPSLANNYFADPLHSQPIVVGYGGSDSEPDATVFLTTNQGFLHAINTTNGHEIFSFIPKELLGNLNKYYENEKETDKTYGLDGSISYWFNDANGNGVLVEEGKTTVDTDEHIYLYLTMRRGGKNLYALDVTDRSAPTLKWTIKGGTGDFAKLGDTWSQPQVAKIKFNGTDKHVLIFGGGYDSSQDSATLRKADSIGNAVYIIDAETGERLWWSSASGSNKNISGMSYSIPANITTVDVNADGYTNYFFAADMGGQVLRFDINSGNSGASNFVTGAGIIANLATKTATGHRRFYNAPDVALITRRGEAPFLTISIGSGFRADPQAKTAQDRFYMIRDYFPFSTPTSYLYGKDSSNQSRLLTEADLYDTTENDIEQGTASEQEAAESALASSQGWFISLDSSIGEKVLAESVTFSEQLVFTTYLPEATANPCAAAAGASRLYIIDLLTAVSSRDNNNNGTYSAVERYNEETLGHSGIAPKAVIIYNPNSTKRTLCVGTECLADKDNPLAEKNPLAKTYWRENQ